MFHYNLFPDHENAGYAVSAVLKPAFHPVPSKRQQSLHADDTVPGDFPENLIARTAKIQFLNIIFFETLSTADSY